MKRVLLTAVAALPMIASSAHAETEPTPGKLDGRIRVAAYNPMQVLSVKTTGLTAVELVYEPGESIQTASGPMVALKPVCPEAGDKPCPKEILSWEPPANSWVLVTSANTLMIDPEMGPPDTVLWVRTDGPSGQRLYRYHLGTRTGNITDKVDKGAYMTVMYTYVHKPNPQEMAAAQERREAAAERFSQARLAAEQAAAPQNREYEMRGTGCSYLAPRSTTDDGVRTRMLFATGTQIPAILHVIPNGTPKGDESTLSVTPETRADGTMVVLPAVYPLIRLRYGNELVCDMRPKPPETQATAQGRASQAVVRTARQ